LLVISYAVLAFSPCINKELDAVGTYVTYVMHTIWFVTGAYTKAFCEFLGILGKPD